GLVLLLVGIVGVGGPMAAAGSGPTCDQQVAELNNRLLGSAPPADPEALRQRYAAYEKAFAKINCGAPASPSPVQPSPGDNAPPYVLKEGIFEPAEDILPQWDFVNYWVGHVRDQWVSVYAGSQDADPNQGGVVIEPYGAPPGQFLPTPVAAGSVKIVSAEDTRLTLLAMDGTSFVFDVESESFVS
ncbi:MAG: hypothetical protein ACREXY_24415, partial [Gammaproteobacteria bacterium]